MNESSERDVRRSGLRGWLDRLLEQRLAQGRTWKQGLLSLSLGDLARVKQFDPPAKNGSDRGFGGRGMVEVNRRRERRAAAEPDVPRSEVELLGGELDDGERRDAARRLLEEKARREATGE